MLICFRKGHLFSSAVTSKRIITGICVFLLAGCATVVQENPRYPDSIPSPSLQPSSDVIKRPVQARIALPVNDVRDALIAIINQHAFIWHIDAGNPGSWELSYSDVTTLLLQDKPVQVSLPYTVKLEVENPYSTQITVYCRWDLIVDENYRKTYGDRFTNLRDGMETEAYTLIQRTATQATGGSAWAWMREEERI